MDLWKEREREGGQVKGWREDERGQGERGGDR